jgi:hypothetical protein
MWQERQAANINSMQFLKLTCAYDLQQTEAKYWGTWLIKESQLRRFRPSAKYCSQVSLFPLESSAGGIAIPHVGEGHERCLFSPGNILYLRGLTNSDTLHVSLQTSIHIHEFAISSPNQINALSQIHVLNVIVVHLLKFGKVSQRQTHARYITVSPSPTPFMSTCCTRNISRSQHF